MTMPYVDFGMDEEGRKQRMLQGLRNAMMSDGPTSLPSSVTAPVYGRPEDFLPPSPPAGQYTLSQIGNAAVGQGPTTHPVRDAILRALDGGLRGLQAGNNPNAPGEAGFLGSLGQSYAGMQEAREQQQRQAIADRIAAQTFADEHNLRQAQALYYGAGATERGTLADKNRLLPTTDPDETPVDVPGLPLGTLNRRTHVFTPAITAGGTPAPVRPFAPRTTSSGASDKALTYYQRMLGEVRRERTGVMNRPKYPDAASQAAEALSRTRAGGYPNFALPGTRPSGGSGPAKLPVTQDEFDALNRSGPYAGHAADHYQVTP